MNKNRDARTHKNQTTPHYITLHYTKLHYTELHYTTPSTRQTYIRTSGMLTSGSGRSLIVFALASSLTVTTNALAKNSSDSSLGASPEGSVTKEGGEYSSQSWMTKKHLLLSRDQINRNNDSTRIDKID